MLLYSDNYHRRVPNKVTPRRLHLFVVLTAERFPVLISWSWKLSGMTAEEREAANFAVASVKKEFKHPT